MAGSAPYEVNVTGTDDETFLFSVSFEMANGDAFSFADFEIEYAIGGDRGIQLKLTAGDGVDVSPPVVTFRCERGRLLPGFYAHGCRIRHVATSDEFQIFDGSLTITQGSFR